MRCSEKAFHLFFNHPTGTTPPQIKVLHLNLKGSQGITIIFIAILEKYESSLLNGHHAQGSKLDSLYKL